MPKYSQARPTHIELTGKIRQAAESVKGGKIEYIEPDTIAAEVLELDVCLEEVPIMLIELLEKARPDDYRGGRPPQRSYERPIKGLELFPFACHATGIGKTVYFKFALKHNVLYLISFHEDAPI